MPVDEPNAMASDDHEDRRLMGDARTGDGDAVAALYDRHADALYAFARCVLGDDTAAEDVVVDVMVDSCGPRSEPPPVQRSVRHHLARATYLRCATPAALPAPARSRGVLALCLHGRHSYREALALTGASRVCLGELMHDEVVDRLRRPA